MITPNVGMGFEKADENSGTEFWCPAVCSWTSKRIHLPGQHLNAEFAKACGVHWRKPAEENADTFFRPSGWVRFSERAPAKSDCPFVALFAGHNNEPQSHTFDRVPASAGSWSKDYYAWQSIPKPPAPPKSDAEIAWERWRDSAENQNRIATGEDHCKAAFIAGFNAEVAK